MTTPRGNGPFREALVEPNNATTRVPERGRKVKRSRIAPHYHKRSRQ